MRLIQVLVVLLLAAGWSLAAEPEHELEPKKAVSLIALLNEMREEPIAIASIIAGRSTKNNFQATHVRRVEAIHPVAEDGKRVRRVCRYDFFWNETYGWFVHEVRAGRGGDEIWIWSETEGRLVIR